MFDSWVRPAPWISRSTNFPDLAVRVRGENNAPWPAGVRYQCYLGAFSRLSGSERCSGRILVGARIRNFSFVARFPCYDQATSLYKASCRRAVLESGLGFCPPGQRVKTAVSVAGVGPYPACRRSSFLYKRCLAIVPVPKSMARTLARAVMDQFFPDLCFKRCIIAEKMTRTWDAMKSGVG